MDLAWWGGLEGVFVSRFSPYVEWFESGTRVFCVVYGGLDMWGECGYHICLFWGD
jgi:hypothetical protein